MSNFTPEQLRKIRDTVAAMGQRGASRALSIPRTTIQSALADPKMPKLSSAPATRITMPSTGTRTFIFSSAQSDTPVHIPFLRNLEAYAMHTNAEILISGYTYNKGIFEDCRKSEASFSDEIIAYICDYQVNLGDKILFCGEMNTLPTATDPLSGFETYTREKWGIFPHPRVALASVATMFNAASKIIMTTGSVTMPNYIRKKAGIKAEFHHVIGAVIVELCHDGRFFARHLIAEADGSFQDLTNVVKRERVTQGHHVQAVTWGDVHTAQLDPIVATAAWGIDDCCDRLKNNEDTMLDALRPRYQFFHDVLDFKARNHHTIKDHHERFKLWHFGDEDVAAEISRTRRFLRNTERPWCMSVVVNSNHDRALLRWLREADYRQDPVNALFFLRCQTALYEAMQAGDDGFIVAEWAVKNVDKRYSATPNVKFLRETDSFKVAGIENGLHGDVGANGSKGHLLAFAKMGPKANVAHTHSAAIYEGIYQAGTSSLLDMGYNARGLSSWNHSHIVTYPNGKRAIVTMQNGRWHG